MSRIGLYLHTLRHLRPRQLFALARARLPRRPVKRVAVRGLRSPRIPWRPGSERPRALLSQTGARFLAVEREITSPADWRAGAELLWLYHLHYFDDLRAPADGAHRRLQETWMQRWIAENPPGSAPGWDPYPTSLRIVNWICALLEGRRADEALLESLAHQAEHLFHRLEHHLLGNHLWANAKALVFAGTALDAPRAMAWRNRGLALVERELREQVLDDGGHFERSPSYHAIVHEDLLDLIQLWQCFGKETPAWWLEKARVMDEWSAALCHPDGGIGYFNDAVLDMGPERAERARYAARLGLEPAGEPAAGLRLLEPSGYFRMQRGAWVLLGDAAPVGPDHQPGHAHADTLCFELSHRGRRVFVNAGTSCYGRSERRAYERSTPAHNTVCVDGEDSSEVWGAFRVARRARAQVLAHEDGDSTCELVARHDGYERLRRGLWHRRHWRLDDEGTHVEDLLGASPARDAVARFRLAPDVAVERVDERSVRLCPASGEALLFRAEGSAVALDDEFWAEGFGRLRDTRVLRVPLRDRRLVVSLGEESRGAAAP